MKDGDKIAGIVGYEADRYVAGVVTPVAAAGTYTSLSSSPYTAVRGTSTAQDYQQTLIYQAPSGASVFSAGTLSWAWGLYNNEVQRYADPRLQQMTANVLDKFVAGNLPLPAMVKDLRAEPRSDEVVLTWTNDDSRAARSSYVLDRSSAPTFDTSTAISLPASASSYTDSVLPGVHYYRLRAVGEHGNSPYANASASTRTYDELVGSRSDVLARWRLGERSAETAFDAKGVYNGSYTGGTSLGVEGAVVGDRAAATGDTAAGFNGSTSRVTVPALPPSGNFTIEGWSHLTSTTNANYTLYGGNSTVRILVRPGAPISGTTAYAGVWIGGTEYVLQPSVSASNVGTWVHWMLSRDGSTLNLYRNGALVGQRMDLPAGTANVSGDLGASLGGPYFMAGSLDEVQVYSGVRSSADAANDYAAGPQQPSTAGSTRVVRRVPGGCAGRAGARGVLAARRVERRHGDRQQGHGARHLPERCRPHGAGPARQRP